VNSPNELAAHTPNFDLTTKRIDGDKGGFGYNIEVVTWQGNDIKTNGVTHGGLISFVMMSNEMTLRL
jgi:hypothetical protein